MRQIMRHFPAVFLMTVIATAVNAQDYAVSRLDDGPFSFRIMSVQFNEDSSLRRESVLLNLASCPVEITRSSLKFSFEDRRLHYNVVAKITARDSIRALELRHALFDIFGQHMKNLANLEAKDLEPGTHTLSGRWNLLRENDATLHLTTVTFVGKVRLADGSVWTFDPASLGAALQSLALERSIDEEEKE